MLEKDLLKRPGKLKLALKGGVIFLISASTLLPGFLHAQQNSAASGMTTGLPGVSPAREAELMHIRAQAQAAKPEAEAAAMQRSAEMALDKKANQRLLNEARENKRLKEEASRNLQYEKAANAFNKVSRKDIEAYSSNTGRVKVQQEVPSEFLAALPPEEEEEPGFFRKSGNATASAAKKAVSWIPFVGKKDKDSDYIEPPSPTASPAPQSAAPVPAPARTPPPKPQVIPGNVVDTRNDDPGMFEKMGNVFKRDKDKSTPVSSTAEDKGFFEKMNPFVSEEDTSIVIQPTPANAAQPGSGSIAVAPPADTEKKGFFKGMFGGKEETEVADFANPTMAATNDAPGSIPPPGAAGAALFGPHSGNEDFAPPPIMTASAPPAATPPPLLEPEKKGMFSGLKNAFSFGKKNQGLASAGSGIDPSLFPQSGDSSSMMADDPVKAEKKKMKLPSLPNNLIPKPQISTPEPPKPPTPKKDRSPIHAGGSDLYIVDGAATQFLQFGDSKMSSQAMTLQPGTVVRMTKVGDEWSSIKLSNGSTGIVRNKSLKPSNSGGGVSPGSIPASSPPIASTATGNRTSARITRPVSATGAALETTPGTVGPPVSIPESRLTTGTTNSGVPVNQTP